MRFTDEQYREAIDVLSNARTQLEPNGDNCHCCGDSGHQAFECGFNPLVAVALCGQIAAQSGVLHDTLHVLAGYATHMGEQLGPARVATLEDARLAKARELLESIVCTEGEDRGIVLVDHEAPTVWDDTLKCDRYTHDNFSPLGDALIKLWDAIQC